MQSTALFRTIPNNAGYFLIIFLTPENHLQIMRLLFSINNLQNGTAKTKKSTRKGLLF